MRSIIVSCFILIIISIFFYCNKTIKDTGSDDVKKTQNQNGYNETFKKTGWMSENRYRAVIYILTFEECKSSSKEQIEEKIKFEAIKHLQSEMNITFNHNQYTKTRILLDNYGIITNANNVCSDNNVYYFDIEKKDLKLEFQNIKNTK